MVVVIPLFRDGITSRQRGNILQLIIYDSPSSLDSLTLSSSIFEHRDRERKFKEYFKISFCRYFLLRLIS